MYAENVGQLDEEQLLADARARLERSIAATTTTTTETSLRPVYPSDYTPPTVQRAINHKRYLAACTTWQVEDRKRADQNLRAGR